MDCNFNLFGEPVPPNHGNPGRPPHVPTDEKRNKVMLLLAAGWNAARIASAIGISRPTLKEHYSAQMALRDKALDRVKATRFAMLFQLMADGNVAAHKEFDRLMTKEHLDVGAARMAKPPKEPTLGKKAMAKANAPKAHKDTDWADIVGESDTVQ